MQCSYLPTHGSNVTLINDVGNALFNKISIQRNDPSLQEKLSQNIEEPRNRIVTIEIQSGLFKEKNSSQLDL